MSTATTPTATHPNGQPVAAAAVQSASERLVEVQIKIAEHQLRVMESLLSDDLQFGGSDLFDSVRRNITQDNPGFAPLNIPTDRRSGANWPLWRTETEIGSLRQKSRMLCASNSYAGGYLRNIVSHVIGKGFTYKAGPVKGVEKERPLADGVTTVEQLVAGTQEFVDDFCKRNRWNCAADPREGKQVGSTREQEACRRTFRDGEGIIRFFFLDGTEGGAAGGVSKDRGKTYVRFVEPSCVRDPGGVSPGDGWYLGIKHRVEPYEDLEDIEKYHVVYSNQTLGNAEERDSPTGEEIDAAQIVHIKMPDEDAMIGRGTPFFVYDTFDALYRAGRLQKMISVGAAIRASVAEQWEYQTATNAQITGLAAGLGKAVANPTTGATEYLESPRRAGMIRSGAANRKLVPPVPGMVSENLEAAQGDLRQAASAGCAPEYLVSADASNANFASTKEAGTPFILYGELLQEHFKSPYLVCIWKAIRWGVECGVLPPETLDLIEIQVEAPKRVVRDSLQIAQEDQILVGLGVKDRQTASMERGLDPKTVAQNNAEWQEENGGPAGGFGMELPPAGGGSPFGGPAGGGDKPPGPKEPPAGPEAQ